jgi:phage gpG-like protein
MSFISNISWKEFEMKFQGMLLTLPVQMGTVAVNFFKERFRAQAWTDQSASPWKARKYKKKDSGRAILVKSGRLRNSIHIISSISGSVTVGTEVPYAEIHNEGFEGTESVNGFKRKRFKKSTVFSTEVFNIKSRQGRKSTVKNFSGESYVKPFTRQMNMPQRRFIGNSALLNHKFEQLIIKEIKKAFNQ